MHIKKEAEAQMMLTNPHNAFTRQSKVTKHAIVRQFRYMVAY